jgi:soluble lytic murein transglycosylase-like protein
MDEVVVGVATIVVAILLMIVTSPPSHAAPEAALKYRSVLTREAHFAQGLNAPIPMYAAQIEQESSWRPGITSYDNGRGLAQFMDGTADMITMNYPELGRSDPYNPVWAIRALVRYDAWLQVRVQGLDECQRMAAALKSYNAGLGYVLQSQRVSAHPGQWFGLTEHIKNRQSAANFEASRMYPRWIIFDRQPHYLGWGYYTCGGVKS